MKARTGITRPDHKATARLRSEGVLSEDQFAWCRASGIGLGDDRVQIGWMPVDCQDDIDPDIAPDIIDGSVPAPPRPQPACTFRPWEARDAGTLARLLSSPRVWTYLPERFPGAVDEDDARALIVLANASDHQEVLAIEHDGGVVGQVRLLFDADGRDRSRAEISYWLGEAHWGRGIASAAVVGFTAQAFRAHPDLRRLFARVHRDNVASVRVLQKAGYHPCEPAPIDAPWLFLEVEHPSSALTHPAGVAAS